MGFFENCHLGNGKILTAVQKQCQKQAWQNLEKYDIPKRTAITAPLSVLLEAANASPI